MNRIVSVLLCCLPPLVCSSGQTENTVNSGAADSFGRMALPVSSALQYRTIVNRNIFGLKPPAPVPPAVEPSGNLFLTGLADLASNRQAFFMVEEPGKASAGFVLCEGEQNEWLEVLSVDIENSAVKVRLNRPLLRPRTDEAEVVLSLQTDGVKTAKRVLPPDAVLSPGAQAFLDGTL